MPRTILEEARLHPAIRERVATLNADIASVGTDAECYDDEVPGVDEFLRLVVTVLPDLVHRFDPRAQLVVTLPRGCVGSAGDVKHLGIWVEGVEPRIDVSAVAFTANALPVSVAIDYEHEKSGVRGLRKLLRYVSEWSRSTRS